MVSVMELVGIRTKLILMTRMETTSDSMLPMTIFSKSTMSGKAIAMAMPMMQTVALSVLSVIRRIRKKSVIGTLIPIPMI